MKTPSRSKSPSRKGPALWIYATLAAAFLFRLGFGLCSEIWFIDQQQIYLIGLKFFTTGLWPYFGPDVAYHIQLPGALQGLVVGLPLFLCPIPEAPYIFLNLISFAGLCLFAWYCGKRLPKFPRWIIWTWLLTAPWTLNWSTNIDNLSYVLFGSCLFFIGFLEATPSLSLKLIPSSLANFLMGFGLLWNVQFHMSYVILVPFVMVSVYSQARLGKTRSIAGLFPFVLGTLTPGIFLVLTFLKYGFRGGSGGAGDAVAFNPENILSLFTILARFLSLASCEIPRFIGAHTDERFAYLSAHPWTAPFAVAAAALGILQAVALLFAWFRKKHPQKDWPAVKKLTLLTFLLIYGSFLFAIKAPAAHTFYLTLPIAMLYGFYAFIPWVSRKWFLNIAKALLVCNIVFHLGLAASNFQAKSLYKDRGIFVKAIEEKNYHLLGERRADTLY